MNNYNRINNIFGWVSFLAGFIVYALTMEPTASFWDCGEFISASYGLQVVHPPGAPLFLLIGRFFSLFAGGDLQKVAPMVNMVSVLTSAFCVMFTFWITTYFARRIINKTVETPTQGHLIAIMGAGLVSALTLTFSDTFWFSAVEAEVYASSSFFTALTFWAILKWESHADEKYSDQWLVFIGYLIGLAIGVHLLNLLVIPAIMYVYYFRRYKGRITRRGFILTGLLGMVTLVFVQLGVIPGLPLIAFNFDLLFVNSMNAPFGSGAIFFFVLLIGGLILGIRYSMRKGHVLFNTILLCFSFIIIGYSSYVMVVVRSQANPPIDMNNPEDPYGLVYYLNREQYGDRPLLQGPYFTVQQNSYTIETKGKRYKPMNDHYEVVGESVKYVYRDRDKIFFPRMYDHGDPTHIRGYREWTGLKEKQKPKYKHNMIFFFKYQLDWMYWRYFMWNFSGRQNEEQGYIGPSNGNWITGINFLDNIRLGPQDNLPSGYKQNRGHNKYYLLPFILGIIGLVYHIRKEKQDSFILGLLFLITGVILIVYLNPPPYEPRERDYVFVGSFQVFCTWVGLGVLGLAHWLSKRMSYKMAAGVSTGVALLAAPTLMGSQNWDDHDRSNRYLTIDFAKDYLSSCPKNAVLFTNGDNDTYPLWYAQNVEKFRTDVRVINYSLLGDGDYANGLRRQAYESAPLKLTFAPEQYIGDRRQIVYEAPDVRYPQGPYYELKDIMKFVASESESDKKAYQKAGETEYISYYPTQKLKITPDIQRFISNGWISANDTVNRVNEIDFELTGGHIFKNGLLLLDIIANNINERPICFTTTTGDEVYMGLSGYFEERGLVYRLVPFTSQPSFDNIHGKVNTDTLYKLLVNTYKWGGMESYPMFVDDKAKLVPVNVRRHFRRLAEVLVEEGKNDKAIAALDHCQVAIPDYNYPFDDYMIYHADIYYKAKAKDKARKLLDLLGGRAAERLKYYNRFRGRMANEVKGEKDFAQNVLNACEKIASDNGDTEESEKMKKLAQ